MYQLRLFKNELLVSVISYSLLRGLLSLSLYAPPFHALTLMFPFSFVFWFVEVEMDFWVQGQPKAFSEALMEAPRES